MTSGDRQSYPLLSLTSPQRDRFEATAAQGPIRFQRRAQVILLADRGLAVSSHRGGDQPQPVGGALLAAPLPGTGHAHPGSRPTGRRARRARPGTGLPATEAPPDGQTAVDPDLAAPIGPGSGTLSLETLCDWYSVDAAHGQYVAALALQLFDATEHVHGLDPALRRVLEAAARVHNIAYEIDPAHHHEIGRDILLRHPLADFTPDEQRMLALLTVFHRKKVRPDREPAFAALDKAQQRDVLALAALLRLADSLDYSQSQTVTISDVRVSDERLMLVIEGRNADLNVTRAVKMADLWEQQFGLPVQVWERFPLSVIRADMVRARLEPGLNLPEAGRVLMGHYLALVEQHAEQLREGHPHNLPFLERDVGRLHGVLKAFERYFDAAALGNFKKDARWISQQATEALTRQAIAVLTREALPASAGEQAADLLRDVIQMRQDEASQALESLARTLDGRRYRQFLTDLLEFSRQVGYGVFPGDHTEMQVGTQAAVLIWTDFNALRSERVPQQGIEAQWRLVGRFYNNLQFLASLLGDSLDEVMAAVQPLEAQLRDIMLGQAVLDAFQGLLAEGESRKRKRDQALRPAIERWIGVQEAWLREANDQLVPLWATLHALPFRRQLALAVAQP